MTISWSDQIKICERAAREYREEARGYPMRTHARKVAFERAKAADRRAAFCRSKIGSAS